MFIQQPPRPPLKAVLTLSAGDSGSESSASFGAAEVFAVVQTLIQGQLGSGAPHSAHHHRISGGIPWPEVCFLMKGTKITRRCQSWTKVFRTFRRHKPILGHFMPVPSRADFNDMLPQLLSNLSFIPHLLPTRPSSLP